MRADNGRAFEYAGAHTLTRHFEQAEMRDAAHLNASAIILERFLDRGLVHSRRRRVGPCWNSSTE